MARAFSGLYTYSTQNQGPPPHHHPCLPTRTCRYFDGAKFEGSFDQVAPHSTHSQVILPLPGRATPTPSPLQDRKHGQGVMQHVNGDVYQEMWDFGRCVSSVKLKPSKSRSKKK